MNLAQVFVAFALFFISTISALGRLIIDSSLQDANFPVGGAITFTVNDNLGTLNQDYEAVFIDIYGNQDTYAGKTGIPASFIPTTTLYGNVNVIAKSPSGAPAVYKDSLMVNFNVYMSLTVVTPSSGDIITYGQPINLAVSTDGPVPVEYTASFSCPTGSYQITGLTTGISYNLVPAGLYGKIVVTVIATNTSPGTLVFTIFKPSNNIPPALIPGRLPYYPSVYAKMNDGKVLEIISVEYSQKDSN